MQMAGRTPAATAMTAMTLDALSADGFRLGLGVSGPRSSRAGTARPSANRSGARCEYVRSSGDPPTREAARVRAKYYQIPYAGADATGLCKPLKSILHGRPEIPFTCGGRAKERALAARSPTAGFRPSSPRAA